MANYRGLFRAFDWLDSGNTNGNLYSVHIGTFSADTYTEIAMAGNQPFVVTYNTSDTPFEPVRTSTATISIVHNDYMEDILPNTAQETPIYLYNETDRQMEWCGYLTPKVYDQNYTEEYETIQLEAADCVSVLQYIDYQTVAGDNAAKAIVSLKDILAKVCDGGGLLSGFYWSRSKQIGNTIALPEIFRISEKNFFYNDTDEPWKMSEVLEEACRYFGLTAFQWKDRLYLCDYRYFHSNSDMYGTWYSKAGSYSQGSASHLGGSYTVSSGDVRSATASISFEPVYNKCVVKDNMYAADTLIPNLFDDQYLTNRIDEDNFYAYYLVQTPAKKVPTYPWGSKWYTLWIDTNYKKDQIKRDNGKKSSDDDYLYYHRPYTHKYWKSCYNGIVSDGTGGQSDLSAVGGTIIDMGVVRDVYISEYHQRIVPSKLDYTRYICISQQNQGVWGGQSSFPVMSLSGFTNICPITSNSYIVLKCSAIFEKYIDRPYINPDWLTESVKIGGWTGSAGWAEGFLNFKLKIGDKYWNGSTWTTTNSVFSVALEDTNDDYGAVNEERHVLNNISYELGLNEDGYCIPLDDVDPLGEISFDICLPAIQFWYKGEVVYNGYCWLKDFDLKIVQKGQDDETQESDIIYENIIDESNVNDLREITLKLTTLTTKTKPSYSNVMYESNGTIKPVETILEVGSGAVRKRPEENIVEKYVEQYSTPTKKIVMDLEYQGISPVNKLFGIDVDNPSQGFVQLGTTIDYLYDKQTITCVQMK